MSLLINSNISSSLVRENVQGSAADIVFRRTDFLNFMRSKGRVRAWKGGAPQGWNLVTAANSSAETYSEGQAVGQPGKQTYGRTSLNPFYTRIQFGYSGHVADQVRQGGVYDDPISMELQKAVEDLFVKVESTLVGSTADQGVQSVIDGGDTYANVAPGSVTSWKALETAVSAALSYTALEDNIELAALTPYTSQPTDILAPMNQVTNYQRLAGASATTSLMRFSSPANGGSMDLGSMPGGMLQGRLAWNGMPWTPISGLTTTVILLLDMASDFAIEVFRDVTVEPLAKTSDDTNAMATFACAIRCHERNKHIKLTGVTA
jgi:hypothetical protein